MRPRKQSLEWEQGLSSPVTFGGKSERGTYYSLVSVVSKLTVVWYHLETLHGAWFPKLWQKECQSARTGHLCCIWINIDSMQWSPPCVPIFLSCINLFGNTKTKLQASHTTEAQCYWEQNNIIEWKREEGKIRVCFLIVLTGNLNSSVTSKQRLKWHKSYISKRLRINALATNFKCLLPL